ncbi:MAG: HAD-IA family hydrolase [Bacteroidetes bacterium]|nr:HAD-IA family hydrolase [Bacteroidota bacterium]MBU1719223.1 HAD-IA family hydrolase [Bacteroidota bacterium]
MGITTIIFDWGNTLMRDFPDQPGAMAHWPVVEVMPGIEDLLKEVSGKYTLCVATNAGVSDTALMEEALKRVGLHKYFQYFFSSKDLGYSKPDPRFFLAIAAQMDVLPMECLMIGNDPEKDIRGAKTAGMKTILYDETASEFLMLAVHR